MNRRRFLSIGGAGIASALFLSCDSEGPRSTQPLLRAAMRWNERVERALFRHRSMDHAPRNAALAGNAYPQYFVSDHVPRWDPGVRGTWALRVSGLVDRELSLTMDDLMRLPSTTQRLNHFCVEGWNAIGVWTGVRVSELARLAGRRPEAQYVDFTSFDAGFHESWDIESAMHPQTIVAYGMDGHFLGPGHGAPARVMSPIKLGYKLTKYLTGVTFLPARNGGYWTDRGYEWYAGT